MERKTTRMMALQTRMNRLEITEMDHIEKQKYNNHE
jgi:hypothetical protein